MAPSPKATSSEIEKSFIEYKIVPDVLTVVPQKVLNVSYPNDIKVDFGNELTPTQVKDKPQVTWDAEKGAYYTLLFVDPDAPSRTIHPLREVRHWLVMNIPESDVANGDEVCEYRGSGPPKWTGLHRYTFLVFKQPNGSIAHDEPRIPNAGLVRRLMTSTAKLVKKYDLGNPEFGNFYQAQYET